MHGVSHCWICLRMYWQRPSSDRDYGVGSRSSGRWPSRARWRPPRSSADPVCPAPGCRCSPRTRRPLRRRPGCPERKGRGAKPLSAGASRRRPEWRLGQRSEGFFPRAVLGSTGAQLAQVADPARPRRIAWFPWAVRWRHGGRCPRRSLLGSNAQIGGASRVSPAAATPVHGPHSRSPSR